MAISFGPKLGLLYNALIGESYFDSLRLFLQSVDQLIDGSVINATQVSPPSSPNPGDAYLLIGGTPGGAWTGQAGNIAFWDAQLTTSGTNNVVPGWVFLTPKAGWVVWNVALGNLIVYNGSSWSSLTGGANFPTNTNITSLTGIPNTTINGTGYVYNDGTNPATTIGDAVTAGGAGPNGFMWGTGNFGTPTSGGSVIVGEGPWTGLDYTGVGVGVVSSAGGTVLGASGIQSSGTVEANYFNAIVQAQVGYLKVGSTGPAVINSFAGNQLIHIAPLSNSTNPIGVQIGSGTGVSPIAGIGMLAFGSDYYVQTTVGAAGSASSLPATPKGYLPFQAPDGSTCVIPYYAAS